MGDPVEFIITVSPGATAKLVAHMLQEKGFNPTNVLDEISMIVGTADPSNAAALLAVDGVSAVEPSEPIQLSPGDPQ
jgi:hypothetical protein